MAREYLDEEMVASYAVEITGIERTKAELAKLDYAIQSLRQAQYGPTGVTVAGYAGGRSGRLQTDIFKAKVDQFEGRVQTAATSAMSRAMQTGQKLQAQALDAAETAYGKARMKRGKGNSAGRNDSGDLIKALRNNVETLKEAARSTIVGWHGWPKADRFNYASFQERGTRGRKSDQRRGSVTRKQASGSARAAGQKKAKGLGVPAVNSLGFSIIKVREELKRELGKIKR